jgi:hypothetical protein
MKIRSVKLNNKRKVFEVKTSSRTYPFPFSKAAPRPTTENPVQQIHVDKEIGREGFSYQLASGGTGTIHIEQALEYNNDPNYLRDQLLYKLTLEARRRVAASPLAKREIIRDSARPRHSSIGYWIKPITASPSISWYLFFKFLIARSIC